MVTLCEHDWIGFEKQVDTSIDEAHIGGHRDKHGLVGEYNKRSAKSAAEFSTKTDFLMFLHRRVVSVIAGLFAQSFSLLNEDDGRRSFRQSQDDLHPAKPSEYCQDPKYPTPGCTTDDDETRHGWAQCGASEWGESKHGQCFAPCICIPDVCNQGTRIGEGGSSEGSSKESEH